MDAYVRFRALRAAIVRIVQSRDTERTKISSFLSPARKKSLGGIPRVLGYDRRQAEIEIPTKIEALTNTWEEGWS